MRNKYTYRQTVQGYRYSRFRRRMWWLGVSLIVLIGIGIWVLLDLLNSGPTSSRASKIETRIISDNLYTMTSPYFKFQDTSKWVLDKPRSTPDTFIYTKFRRLDVLAQMIVYVNKVPIPLHLATPRVLPVRPVNDNSFDVTQTSDPCGKTYGSAPHVVKMVKINEASMLCDPDSAQYFVQLAMISGDYRLNLKRPDGTPIQFVITYKETTPDIKPQTIIRVAKSFQTL